MVWELPPISCAAQCTRFRLIGYQGQHPFFTLDTNTFHLFSSQPNALPPPSSSPWLDPRPGTQRKRRLRLRRKESKNYDRNGPEGQFMAASTTMCNAGSPPYCAVFLISPQSIKVSMKKKKEEKRARIGAGCREYIPGPRGPVHVCFFFSPSQASVSVALSLATKNTLHLPASQLFPPQKVGRDRIQLPAKGTLRSGPCPRDVPKHLIFQIAARLVCLSISSLSPAQWHARSPSAQRKVHS